MSDEREQDAEQQVVADPVDPVEHPEPVPATQKVIQKWSTGDQQVIQTSNKSDGVTKVIQKWSKRDPQMIQKWSNSDPTVIQIS